MTNKEVKQKIHDIIHKVRYTQLLKGDEPEEMLIELFNQAKIISSNLPVIPSFLALRKSAKLTLRKVEKDTGVSNAYLSQLENGKVDNPSYKIVRTLWNYYRKHSLGIM